jgi:hypothetical protein
MIKYATNIKYPISRRSIHIMALRYSGLAIRNLLCFRAMKMEKGGNIIMKVIASTMWNLPRTE